MSTLLSYSLCSVQDVKENLGLASSNSQYNNLIVRMINRATDVIETYCGRRFKTTTYNDIEYDAPNTYQIVLKQRPVQDLTTFQIRNTSLNDDDWEDVDTNLYFLDSAAAVIDLNFRATGNWNRYKFTYTAGYDSIPADLQEACAALAAYFVNNASSEVGIQEKEEGQRRVRFFEGIKGTKDLFSQLGIDETLNSYANTPINADK